MNYKKRVSEFMNDMVFCPVVHYDPYLFDKAMRDTVGSSVNVSLGGSFAGREVEEDVI